MEKTRQLKELIKSINALQKSIDRLSNKIGHDHLDKRIYFLTIISVIFMPLTFITGLLGSNVEGIPFSEHPWAFFWVTLICVGIGVTLFIYFKIKKWI